MSVLAFFGQHLGEGGHHIEVQAVHFVVEALGIQGALRSENRHGVIDVLLFVRRDSGKGLAKTSRRYLRDAGIACDGEGFQHDFLDDQAANKVTLRNATEECFTEDRKSTRLNSS